ncbi:glycosyltransferase family 39 protein [Achromobacter xylosoxidans]
MQALGWSAWTTYVLGALCTLGGFFIYWRMLRGMRGGAYALVALLAGLCVTFYNGRLHFYNHEIPLITFVAGAAAACWRAWQTRKIVWWVALGLCLGLGALSKYQAAVAALCVFVFWLSQRGWRDPMQVFGLQVAALTALAVFFPHLYWLIEHNFEPLGYAMSSSLGADLSWGARSREVGRWWGDQILNRALPAWALLAALWLVTRRLRPAVPQVAADVAPDAARALLLAFGLVPLLFVSMMALVSGAHVQLHWGTPYLLFVVPAALELAGGGAWTRRVPRAPRWSPSSWSRPP